MFDPAVLAALSTLVALPRRGGWNSLSKDDSLVQRRVDSG